MSVRMTFSRSCLTFLTLFTSIWFIAGCGDDKSSQPEPIVESFVYVPRDFPTIQSAIDSSTDYDTIIATEGTYEEFIDFKGKRVTVASEFLKDGDTSHISRTVISPVVASPDLDTLLAVVTLTNAEDSNSVLCGLTVTCDFQSEQSRSVEPLDPTGIRGMLCSSSPIISDCVIEGLIGPKGAAAYFRGGVPLIRNCVFRDNLANEYGNIEVHGSRATFTDCTFENNTATRLGGAVFAESSNARFLNCLFLDNRAHAGGAAIGAINGNYWIDHCVFEANGDSNCSGGAIVSGINAMRIRDCIFIANVALYGSAYYGMLSYDTVSGCTFRDNIIHEEGRGNFSFFDPGQSLVENCTFVNNSSLGGLGSVIGAFDSSDSITIRNCIIAYNDGCSSFSDGRYGLSCCDIYGNSEGDWPSWIEHLEDANGNISSDPMFCDTASADFRISEQSPCAPANNECGELIGSKEIGCQ